MKVYTVLRMDKDYYDFSTAFIKLGCFMDKDEAIKCSKENFKDLLEEYDEEAYIEKDDEYGWYFMSFGEEENAEEHCVFVDDWEVI
jgi:hypothetical protein